ncbi:hypothetical protein F0562_021801 [Nyssa sinensis]|uniref:NAC domain-containing protein n=1 Tax=Nyssa sinensis TaxID=561372 RepID=A0A5J5BLP8_9ASTE|nr:hypothetical protein F0562_021801 [Nyssa sinensis]
MERESNSSFQLLPGFRFHPSDEELIVHYLLNKLKSRPLPAAVVTEIDIYKHDPWELPSLFLQKLNSFLLLSLKIINDKTDSTFFEFTDKALFGEHEWYFFSPRDRKYPNGERPNRTAASGYWKATGTDKPILTSSGSRRIGVKKALVFYTRHPPKAVKTDWIMNEYRVPETMSRPSRLKGSMRVDEIKLDSWKECLLLSQLDDWVLCRVRQKGNMSNNMWEVQDSPSKELMEYLPNIEELPSAHTQPNKDIITDYLLYQALPITETISSASFQYGNNISNCGSVYEAGSHTGNSPVTISFFDSLSDPSKVKPNEGNSYENILPSTKMVTSDSKNEDLPGNTLTTKLMNLSSQNQSQGEIYNLNLSNAIIIPQEFNEHVYTGRFLQQ